MSRLNHAPAGVPEQGGTGDHSQGWEGQNVPGLQAASIKRAALFLMNKYRVALNLR